MSASNGGPAFPGSHSHGDMEQVGGMSLRDYFAAVAIWRAYVPVQMVDGSHPYEHELQNYADRTAREAYRIADAMLAEREKTK